ncbi:MAG: DUF6537 domain-containing protein [bacterium]
MAYQAGAIPLKASSIEAAIRMNGVQVEQNLQAFRYGRLWLHDPQRVRELVEPPRRGYEEERARWLRRLRGPQAREFWRGLQRTFPGYRRVRFHLHPPLLRAVGVRRKVAAGPWVLGLFRLLRALRRLRGTPLDPFGYLRVRREERELVRWYRGLVERALQALRPDTYAQVVELVAAPEGIRGYEDVKRRHAARTVARAEESLARLLGAVYPEPAAMRS